MSTRPVRRTITAPPVSRWLVPRLTRSQRNDLALIQLEKLVDIHDGVATEETLWDMLRDAFTWQRVAELLRAGEAEMATQLRVVTDLVEHYRATGRIEFRSQAHDQAARQGCNHMEELADVVDRATAMAAADWSEARVAELQAASSTPITSLERKAA